MNDSEKLEDFSAPKLDVTPSVHESQDEKRSRNDASGSVELEIQEFPTPEGDYDVQVDPLAEGTTPREPPEWGNVEPELSRAVNTTARAPPRLPSFAQSEFYTVMCCPITSALVSIRALVRTRADPSTSCVGTDCSPSAPQTGRWQPQDDCFALSRAPFECRVGVFRKLTLSFHLLSSS